jgi:CubicO group peptidase (beta-lactamase class C family)
MSRPGRAQWLALACVVLSSCSSTPGETDECPSAVAMAESIYVECVESIGLRVEELEITESGDISVSFGEGYTEMLGELARRECEPPMQETLALGLLACESTKIGHPAAPEELAAQVERAADAGFSGSVAIVRDGMPVWKGGVGLADREQGLANAPGTAFDCGSIMKVVTAAAIYRLEGEGSLSRAEVLGDLFTDVPADKAAITLDWILTHRAGFDEFHDTEGDFEPMDRATALQRILAQELLFEPGTDESYSNSGYTLLAMVVEDRTGMPFMEYIRTELFVANGMTKSGVYGDALWPAGEAAIGYDDGTFECNSPGCWPAPSWALVGNGGLVSTVEDLVRWTAAIDGTSVLSADAREAFRRDVLGGRGITIDGETVYFYSGRNDYGFGAAIAEVPSRATVVVVASNAAASYSDTALTAQLLQMTMGALIELDSR